MKIIKSRIFKALVILFVIGFILGIISYFIINNNDIDENIYNYFELIKQGNFNYLKSLFNSIILNNKWLFFIWISGILLISFILIPFIIIYKGISLGIIFISLMLTFKIKGIILFILLLFPSVLINEIIYIFCGYYSLNFSMKTYNSIKKNKLINIKSFYNNYFYIYIIFTIVLIISSIIEIYVSSNIIKNIL
ncbi:MAG: stage II sporulation protein M [bacterium]|nr:stage II sporulation protein M [bacterium]